MDEWDLRAAIQECAYYIWDREGRPEGQSDVHWAMALKEIEERFGRSISGRVAVANFFGVSNSASTISSPLHQTDECDCKLRSDTPV